MPLGEPPEDPMLLFSVLYGLWTASYVAFNGDAVRELAGQFLALAEKQKATGSLMIGHRLMGMSLVWSGDVPESRAHYDQAVALYDPAEHCPLATRFAVDSGVANLAVRSHTLWHLGYPEAALADANHALKNAREIGHAASLMYALQFTRPPISGAGTMRQQTRKPMKLSRWRAKKAHFCGRHLEWRYRVAYWP